MLTRLSALGLLLALGSTVQCVTYCASDADAKPYDTSLRVDLTLEGEAPEPFLPIGEIHVTHFGAPAHVNLQFSVLDDGHGYVDELYLDGGGVPE